MSMESGQMQKDISSKEGLKTTGADLKLVCKVLLDLFMDYRFRCMSCCQNL